MACKHALVARGSTPIDLRYSTTLSVGAYRESDAVFPSQTISRNRRMRTVSSGVVSMSLTNANTFYTNELLLAG
jgi:hypothetical protein